MQSEPVKFIRARYISSVVVCYAITLLFAFYVLNPSVIHPAPVQALKSEPLTQPMPANLLYGLPVRIVIEDLRIDLPIEKGFYNPEDKSWTLTGDKAHFAVVTSPPNNYNGNTFIYGHNNRFVLGPIKNIKPGTKAKVYTINNLVFTYQYVSDIGVDPADTSVLDYRGPHILTVQTCSGDWNEVRQLYKFKFQKVETNG